MRAIDDRIESLARVHRADDQVGIADLCVGAVPVGVKNVAHTLYILCIRVYDAIFAVAGATAAAERRECKVRGHNIGRLVINDPIPMS